MIEIQKTQESLHVSGNPQRSFTELSPLFQNSVTKAPAQEKTFEEGKALILKGHCFLKSTGFARMNLTAEMLNREDENGNTLLDHTDKKTQRQIYRFLVKNGAKHSEGHLEATRKKTEYEEYMSLHYDNLLFDLDMGDADASVMPKGAELF